MLVTGGCGFIGYHLVRLILREKPRWKLINVDMLTYAGNIENLANLGAIPDSNRYSFVRADIADAHTINMLFDRERIEAVVHLAAETHVDRSLLDSAPFLRTNVEGTRVLLEMATRHAAGRFLQVSTDEVYGSLALGDPPFTEQSPLHPNSPYAASKAAADLFVQAYHRSYDLPTLITRSGNNYGPYQFPEKLLPLFITNALDNQSLPLYGDGEYIRDWIHVEDHVRALLQVLEQGTSGEIYNISAGQEEANQRMADQIIDILHKPRSLIRHVKDRPAHDRRYALDATKIRHELGWEPSISLEDGLQSTISWYREHRAWWERIKTEAYSDYYAQWYGKRLAEVLE
ncbi:MAG: dTDP-glucose 4,6-dehydratase [Deltaproteobacteria bacterium]|nr:dTDP-glucose 4,6-dehydratase [Deltaproteobacteria bacterium]